MKEIDFLLYENKNKKNYDYSRVPIKLKCDFFDNLEFKCSCGSLLSIEKVGVEFLPGKNKKLWFLFSCSRCRKSFYRKIILLKEAKVNKIKPFRNNKHKILCKCPKCKKQWLYSGYKDRLGQEIHCPKCKFYSTIRRFLEI